MKTISEWILECKQHIAATNRFGLYKWKEDLDIWLQATKRYTLAKQIKPIELGPFMHDTDLDWVITSQLEGLRRIKEFLEVHLMAEIDGIT